MRTRNWSIRSKIVALIAVPLAALLALWAFAIALSAGPAVNLLSAQTLLDSVGNPGRVLLAELQRERRLSVEFLSAEKGSPAELTAQRAATDLAIAEFRRTAGGDEAQSAASDTLRIRIRHTVSALDGLSANRVHIDRREIDAIGGQNLYNSVIDTGFQMFEAVAAFGDQGIDRQLRALITVGRGEEYLSRTDSLLAGAFAAGTFTDESRGELLQSISTSRFLLSQGVTDLPERDRRAYQQLTYDGPFNRLRQLQDSLVRDSRAGAASPITAGAWKPAYDTSMQQLRTFEDNATDSLAENATPVAVDVFVLLGAAGLLGLAAFLVSIYVSVRVGRSIVGRLIRLRGEALEMAGERLPAVVRRLQRGETVDVEVETPPLAYGRDEIGQLGYAFNEVQRTAVQSAVEEANIRRGINEVFLNIARRSQTLLHRQLALLDRMERRETEPQELEDLYRVDHLATRMRRHAEDLVILAGAAPGRGWRNPVPVIDVVRGAISEVEDYKRVDIVSVESSAVLGRAVGDVIHLIAELLENAASFSPPHARVQVVGQILPNGYALEIEDRGLGMSPEAIAEANRKLIEPPDFDPADSARLGLFVVAQLADRHGIRVSLRPSAYGGVTAIVLVPGELVAPGQGLNALPAGSSASDTAWDRPLVGTGTEDPSRRSLAALQWQGTEELRSISMTGRPVTINGTATAGTEAAGSDLAGSGFAAPGPADPDLASPDLAGPGSAGLGLAGPGLAGPGLAGPGLADPAGGTAAASHLGPGGPTPSAAADGLTEDGLVQRRRTRPRRAKDEPAAPPDLLPPNQTSPTGLTPTPTGLPSVGKRVTSNGIGPSLTGLTGTGLNGQSGNGSGPAGGLRHGEGPAVLPVSGGVPTSSRPVQPPRIPSPRTAPEPMSPPADRNAGPVAEPAVAPLAEPAISPVAEPSAAPVAGPADEPLLPRRVRQASLAPQLRGPVAERADAGPSRSPEQVRGLMSALQRGTTRGRLEAAGLSAEKAAEMPVTDKQETMTEPNWSEAATVTFPAVQSPEVAGDDNSTDNAPDENFQNRPEKDA